MLTNKIFNASALQVNTFSNVATRLGRPAEPSQQVCSLQSAGLPSLVATPCNRTTTTCLVVQLYTL